MSAQRIQTTAIALFALILALAAPPALADGDGNWQLRIVGAWVDPDFDFTDEDDGVRAHADSDIGLGLSFEYRFKRHLGLEAGVIFAESDVNVRIRGPFITPITVTDSLGFRPVTLGLNFHLTPERRNDFYVGPLLAWVNYDDLHLVLDDQRADFAIDDDFAWGFHLGADFRLGDSPWSIGATLKYLDTSLEVTGEDGSSEKLGFDLFMVSLGVGYRF